MFGLGWTEILVILAIALLVLGPTKLPEIAKGLGKGLRDFRRAVNSIENEQAPPREASNQKEIADRPGGKRAEGDGDTTHSPSGKPPEVS